MARHSAHLATQQATLKVNHLQGVQQVVYLDCYTTHGVGFQCMMIQLQHKYLILQCHLMCRLGGVLSNLEAFSVLVRVVP